MKESLQPGVKSTVEIMVDDARAIAFMGDELRVYATPAIVNDLEYAALELIAAHLDAGESTVGAHVEIRHLKPTPIGFPVIHHLEVTSVEGRMVTVSVSVRDALEEVATASHTRAVVSVEKLAKGVAAKRAALES